MSQRFGTRRAQNKAQTRQIIFETAYALFEEKGFKNVTMRELAAKAGVGLGTIFQHFKDKSTLLVAVFEHDFHPLVKQTFASLPQSDLKQQLLYMVRTFYGYYARRPQISRILIKELYIDETNSERINQSLQDDLARVAAMFEAAKLRGELATDTNVQDATLLWWSYYTAVLFMALQGPLFDVDEQVAVYERLMDQHFKGIAK